MKIRMLGSQYLELTKYPGEEATKWVLVARCRLTKKLAESLQCAEMCFDANGIPRAFEGKVGLKVLVKEAHVEMGDRSFDCDLIHKFKVGRPSGAADNEVSLDLTCRMHFPGKNPKLEAFCEEMNKGDFGIVISAKQESFNFDGSHDESDDEEEADEPEPVAAGSIASKRSMKTNGAEAAV